jgi:predicted nucleotidyltransferase component of viral defense system
VTQPIGLQPDDLAAVMATFGVAEAQVRRDHAISHILAALSRNGGDELIFFGGTALSRTYLLDGRLSEDIDLIAVDHRDDLADVLRKDINAALTRTHGRITWSPGWSRNSDVDPAVAVTAGGIATKIQLLRGESYEPWPTETRAIEQRYRDAPPAILRVPTMLSFAGWKTAAWIDRGAARDLYDLWALERVGALNAESAALFATHGPTSSPPKSWMFKRAPSAVEWQAQLAGQTRLKVTAAEALEAVRTGWAVAVGEDWE